MSWSRCGWRSRTSSPTGTTAPIDLSRAPSDACRHSEVPAANARYGPAAVKRAVWERDQARCTWPMGEGEICGARHQLEFDHDLEVTPGGKPTIGNIRLLCRSHNLMKAERHLGRAFMAKFRTGRLAERTLPDRLSPRGLAAGGFTDAASPSGPASPRTERCAVCASPA